MAFRDIITTLYDDSIKVVYRDKAHRYYAYPRVNYDLPIDNDKAWGKNLGPKGCTTLLGDTLEKKGLMDYSLTKAMMDLFGFYSFKDDDGNRKFGYSKKGAARLMDERGIIPFSREEAVGFLELGMNASKRHTQKAADIGSVVHDAIEQFVKGNVSYSIPLEYRARLDASTFETDSAKEIAYETFNADVECAVRAYNQFVAWWDNANAELLGAEDLIYSKKHNICGTFDGLVKIDGQVILCDWKTSNASESKQAAMPEGVGYTYFIQSAIYAMAWEEMGRGKIDDLMIVSCRKDGGFTTVRASSLGFTVDDLINWARAVIVCYRMMEKTKAALWAHAERKETVNV